MNPTMQQQVWPGWLGPLSTPGNDIKYRLTWDEWCARLRRHHQSPPARVMVPPPGRHEVAARAFLLWFDAAAASNGQHDPPFDDRELAVCRFMHSFGEVATKLDQFSGTELAGLRLLRRRHQTG
jgi:hypothetical protein